MFKKNANTAPEATFKETWQKGDWATKLSFIMGISQLKKQTMAQRSDLSNQ